MQIILSDEEISYLVEALLTEMQEIKQDIKNRRERGLDEGYREKYLVGLELIHRRLAVYVK